jgi:hypothetical protein
MAPPDPSAPGIFALADPARVRALVTAAGFAEPEIEEVATRRTFDDFDGFWRYLIELAGGIAPVLRGLAEDDRATMRELVRTAAEPYATRRGYDFPGLCLNAVTS